jgi:hypothetical protein
MLLNSSKQGNYVRFDWRVNQDVTIHHLRYYPAKDFIVLPGRKGWGRNWIKDVTFSDHLQEEMLRVCRERWFVEPGADRAAPIECYCGLSTCPRCGPKKLEELRNQKKAPSAVLAKGGVLNAEG